jgi:hypothetical protein
MMSMRFPVRSDLVASAVDERSMVAEDAGGSGRYLTDGVNLYRFLGAIASGMGEMVGVENCRSLDVMLVPIGELRARRMRGVVPTGGQ